MTKKIFLPLAISIAGLSAMLFAQNMERHIYNYRETVYNEPYKVNIKHLIETGQYDSATRYCNYLRKNDSMSYDDLEMALATIAWAKGDKSTAYQYVVNSTDYLLKTNAGEHAFTHMLYDFDYAYPLATDTLLEKIVIDKVSSFYNELHDFSQATSGLKFMIADYKLGKIYAERAWLKKQHNPDQAAVTKALAKLREEEEELTKNFLEELNKNGKLLTWKEAGAAYQTQLSFIITKNDSTLHAQAQPYFDKAYKDGELEPRIYVDKLVWMAALREPDEQKLNQLHDSLCTLYKCMQVRRVYMLKNGDSVVVYDENRFGGPKPEK